MTCDEVQIRLCDALDSGRDPLAETLLAQHLTGCTACGKFHRSWVGLEAQLRRRTSAKVLPAEFKSALLNRLPAEPAPLTPAEARLRRAEFEREYQAALALLSRRYLICHLDRVLGALAVAAGCGLLGFHLPAVAVVVARFDGPRFAEEGARQSLLLFCVSLGLVLGGLGWRRAQHHYRQLAPGW